jgi:ribonuclease D
MTKERAERSHRHLDFVIPSSLDIRHSSLPRNLIATDAGLAELVGQIESVDRVAIDTEADSLHCYREKLCLLQISVPGQDYMVDPLAELSFAPLFALLEKKEIVLHGSDFDLRLLRRAFEFKAGRISDTVIAARLLGIQEFSLAALVKQHFDVELAKGSQKANWALRPLPPRMVEYAINDTRYLLALADRLETEL